MAEQAPGLVLTTPTLLAELIKSTWVLVDGRGTSPRILLRLVSQVAKQLRLLLVLILKHT